MVYNLLKEALMVTVRYDKDHGRRDGREEGPSHARCGDRGRR